MFRLESPHGRMLELGGGPTRIMGVLNLTPDSFSDGGKDANAGAAAARGEALVAAGAEVLDLGGESTRPGHTKVTPAEQVRRILPVLTRLRPRVSVPISIDTTRAEVASRCLDAGADWINDTSALQDDPELATVVARSRCPIVLMHQFVPARTGAADEVGGERLLHLIAAHLRARMAAAEHAGITREQILLDPGLGFGTTVKDALTIVAGIRQLAGLGRPLVVGPSRKSFLGAVTAQPVAARAFATAASVTALALAGVELVRVHDVAAMRDVVQVAAAIAREVAHG